MYDINLTRQSIVPQRQRNVVFSLVSLYVLACLLTLAGVIFFVFAGASMIDVYASEIGRLRTDLASFHTTEPTEDSLLAAVKAIKPDLDDIRNLVNDTTAFTPLMESIARAVPEGVWLTRVKLTDPPTSMDSRRGRSKGKSKGTFNAIVLEGLALVSGGDESGGDEAIRTLALNLEQDPNLKDRVKEVKFTETEIKKIRGKEVIGFEITCAFRE